MAQNTKDAAKLPVNRTMPHSQEAEDAVIGAFLTDGSLYAEYGSRLREEDFYVTSDKIIFAAIRDLAAKGMPADIVTLSVSMQADVDRDGKSALEKAGGIERLEELTEAIPSVSNCEYYVEIVKRDSMLRKVIRTAGDIIDSAYTLEDADKCLASAQASIFELGKSSQGGDLVKLSDPATEVMNKLMKVYETKEEDIGLRTHYDNLDNMTNGFLPGQMIVLAARPGCGKTAFAMSIATNIARKDPDRVIATFNLEMSATELVQRMMVSVSRVPRNVIIKGEETPEQLQSLFAAHEMLSKANIYIDQSTGNSADVVMSKCRRLKNKVGRLDLVIIDYLQLMEPTKDRKGNRQQEVSDTSRMIKLMAKDLEVPVLVLSQMSRKIDDREVKTPQLSDLRESGAIEQDADMVMFLNDAGSEDSDADAKPIELKIAKQRNGAVGDIYFVFEKSLLRFKAASGKYLPKNKDADAAPVKASEAATEAGDRDYPEYTDADAPPEEDHTPADIPSGYTPPTDADLADLQSGDIPAFVPGED